jgi:hypothetical protein
MESAVELGKLVQDVQEHLKSGAKADRRAAVVKLERIAALSATLALTLRISR